MLKYRKCQGTSIFGKKLLFFFNRLVVRDLWWKSQNYWRDSLPSETKETLPELFGQIYLTYKLYLYSMIVRDMI